MRTLAIFTILAITLAGCKTEDKSKESTENGSENLAQNTQTFGASFDARAVKTKEEMTEVYGSLEAMDTVRVTFKAPIAEVCQSKGCWMELDLDSEKTAMVRFKDYGFFVPMESAGKTAIVTGKAFIKEVSVEEQRQLAEDAGKPKSEIDRITEPKRSLAFEASGVKIQL